MSLGIQWLWRAPGCPNGVRGLSLIPREQRNPWLFQQANIRRCFSASSGEAETALVEQSATNEVLKGKSHSSFTRALYRRVIARTSGFHPKEPALVKPHVEYPTKPSSYRSLRKHRGSAARQHLLDSIHEVTAKPANDWRSTLQFMLRHTHDAGEILNFRVIIGKGVAAEALRVLSQPDTHISQICRRNESHIRFEETGPRNDELTLNLSGPEDSVRRSLLDIVGVVGKITAVRASDPAWETLLLDVWKSATAQRPEIRLLSNGEVAVDDKTMTLQTYSPSFTNYKNYVLTKRADEINAPTEWTKDSFEKYVAALVHGRVPTHLAQTLYPTPPDHQEVVISLLVDLFTSELTSSALSVSAVKMAIDFIESSGSGFRHASRTIFDQAELLNVPLDAEIFNTLLVSASKARDLGGFNSILKTMVRKGFPLQSRAWVAFMEMVEDPRAKRHIIAQLRSKGLNNNLSILRAAGRQMVILDLRHRHPSTINIPAFIDKQTEEYGTGWLDTITLNKLLDVLGAYGQLDACKSLLELVHARRLASPSVVTMNTLLTHAQGLIHQIAVLNPLLTLWPKLEPNADTYHILFRAGWKRCYPNVLRVVWRYAALGHMTKPKMRHTVSKLLSQERDLSVRRAFYKAWEDVIFGQAELAEARASHGDKLTATRMMSIYIERAGDMKPSVAFITKLDEAIGMDVKIHQLLKEGVVMSHSMRESLTVDIPLEPKPESSTEPNVRAFRKMSEASGLGDVSSGTV
ncbi:hypothetical protein M426DRAFT_316456 [Hypoxylon sp. CI-4A]|nr:hypothetical protein M426DRAFT_316456 [Hypoxylon sp. CI-4A]